MMKIGFGEDEKDRNKSSDGIDADPIYHYIPMTIE